MTGRDQNRKCLNHHSQTGDTRAGVSCSDRKCHLGRVRRGSLTPSVVGPKVSRTVVVHITGSRKRRPAVTVAAGPETRAERRETISRRLRPFGHSLAGFASAGSMKLSLFVSSFWKSSFVPRNSFIVMSPSPFRSMRVNHSGAPLLFGGLPACVTRP